MVKFNHEFAVTSAMLDAIGCVMGYQVVGSALYRTDANDLDVLVLVENISPGDFVVEILGDAWPFCGDYDTEEGKWLAVRSGLVNLIITEDPMFYDKFLVAAELCAALQLNTKWERMVVHRMVRDGYDRAEAIRLANEDADKMTIDIVESLLP